MTEIRETMRVAGKAALKSNVIDNTLWSETQNFMGKFVEELSKDSRLMEKTRTAFETRNDYLQNRAESGVYNEVSKRLIETLNTSDDPGAKFLKGLFLRYKSQIKIFIKKIPNMLYLITVARGDKTIAWRCNMDINGYISKSTKEAHSYLLKESPYIYRKVCGETKSGRMAAGKLDRFRKKAGIMTQARNTMRVSGKASAASGRIDECSLKELRKFMIEFLDGLSKNAHLMRKTEAAFETGNYYLREQMEKEILAEVSKRLIKTLNTSDDPGAKFLKGLFLRHKGQKAKFIEKIPNILYLITLSGDKTISIGCYKQMGEYLSAATQEAHSYLAKKSPYVYSEVIGKTRAGRSTSRKLNRFRERAVIEAAVKKTSVPRAAKKPVLVVPVRIIKVEVRKI